MKASSPPDALRLGLIVDAEKARARLLRAVEESAFATSAEGELEAGSEVRLFARGFGTSLVGTFHEAPDGAALDLRVVPSAFHRQYGWVVQVGVALHGIMALAIVCVTGASDRALTETIAQLATVGGAFALIMALFQASQIMVARGERRAEERLLEFVRGVYRGRTRASRANDAPAPPRA